MFLTFGDFEIAPGFPFRIKVKYETKQQKFYFYEYEKGINLLEVVNVVDWKYLRELPENFEFAAKTAVRRVLKWHSYELKKYLDKSPIV